MSLPARLIARHTFRGRAASVLINEWSVEVSWQRRLPFFSLMRRSFTVYVV